MGRWNVLELSVTNASISLYNSGIRINGGPKRPTEPLTQINAQWLPKYWLQGCWKHLNTSLQLDWTLECKNMPVFMAKKQQKLWKAPRPRWLKFCQFTPFAKSWSCPWVWHFSTHREADPKRKKWSRHTKKDTYHIWWITITTDPIGVIDKETVYTRSKDVKMANTCTSALKDFL